MAIMITGDKNDCWTSIQNSRSPKVLPGLGQSNMFLYNHDAARQNFREIIRALMTIHQSAFEVVAPATYAIELQTISVHPLFSSQFNPAGGQVAGVWTRK
jgi:hypothetical protein